MNVAQSQNVSHLSGLVVNKVNNFHNVANSSSSRNFINQTEHASNSQQPPGRNNAHHLNRSTDAAGGSSQSNTQAPAINKHNRTKISKPPKYDGS